MSSSQLAGGLPLPADELTCLIADDHPAVSELLARYLREHGVTIVGQARDGREALAEVERLKPSVLLLDLRLPHLSGIEVARTIAQRDDLSCAVILYTGYGDHDQLLHAI
ncbi:MAG TPA: response regulator, partial [Gaiellaceae bacterium]|nr:response regulator [Gaiellaceae bacterium]